MIFHSTEPKDRTFVKLYKFLSSPKKRGRNIQKLLGHAMQYATSALKTALKRAIQKTADW